MVAEVFQDNPASARVLTHAGFGYEGEGEVYALALPLADRLELTEVDTRLPSADAWFPPWRTADWRETRREAHAADGRHAHAFTFLGCDRILG